MSNLIKQVLNTIADLGAASQVTLYSVMDSQNGQVIGVFDKGKITLNQNEYIDFKGTPFEKIILQSKTQTYPGILLKESFYFPSYDEMGNSFQCLCIPLYTKENEPVLSVIVLNQPVGMIIDSVPPVLIQLFPLIAAIMETALEKDRWIQLATKDTLTNLYTRAYFETRLEEEVTRVRRHGGEISVIRIEVDKFQEINDFYGYENGNHILREIAKIINLMLRKGIDIPCISNNKIMIFLPNTEVEGAKTLAERLQQRCENKAFLTEEVNRDVNITISVGIAHNRNISLSELSTEDLIERAKAMLKAAKESGENMVMIWW